jgi:hypothetical protein
MILDSYKFLFDEREKDHAADEAFRAASKEEQEALGAPHVALLDATIADFDEFVRGRDTSINTGGGSHIVYEAIPLNYPPKTPEALRWLAKLSRKFEPSPDGGSLRRQIRLLAPYELKQADGKPFEPPQYHTRQVISEGSRVILDASNTEPLVAHTRQLAAFAGLLNDVRRVA